MRKCEAKITSRRVYKGQRFEQWDAREHERYNQRCNPCPQRPTRSEGKRNSYFSRPRVRQGQVGQWVRWCLSPSHTNQGEAMTVHKDMFDKQDTGRCELCGSPTVCVPCTGAGAPPPRPTYFKCEQCGCVCESLFMSSAYPNMCEMCEVGVFEFYGAISEGEE